MLQSSGNRLLESRASQNLPNTNNQENRFSLYGLSYVGAIVISGVCLWINLPHFQQHTASISEKKTMNADEASLFVSSGQREETHAGSPASIASSHASSAATPFVVDTQPTSSGNLDPSHLLQSVTVWKKTTLKSGELLAQSLHKQGVASTEAHRFCHKMAQATSLRRLQKNTPIFLGWNAQNLFSSFAIQTKTHWILIQYDPSQKTWHKKTWSLSDEKTNEGSFPWEQTTQKLTQETDQPLANVSHVSAQSSASNISGSMVDSMPADKNQSPEMLEKKKKLT